MSNMGNAVSDRSWKNTLFVVVVLALVVVGALVALKVVGLGEDPEDPWADKWAPKVRPFVKYVERRRDLEFLHPVHVEFLSEEEFTDQVTSAEEDLDEEDRKQIEQVTGMFRALGLIEGDVDLFEASNDLSGAGTLAYYSYDDKRIRIRGKSLTPEVQVTLVHELTHALQDQRFDLEGRYHDFETDEDTAGETAYDALVEGDAERIERAYEESLSAREKKQLAKARTKEGGKFDKDAADVPEILKTLMGAPYALGEALLTLAVEEGGNDAVDDLFKVPPTTEEHLLDPWTLIADGDGSAPVDEPEIPDGAEAIDSGDFGALGWYLVLSERVPVLRALDATDGWAGDAYAAYEADGRSCVRVRFRGETEQDLVQMRIALRDWSAALPGSPASVEVEKDTLLFESCDPGKDTAVGRESSTEALRLALSRTYFAVGVMKGGLPENVARCGADRIVHEYSLTQLDSPTFGDSGATGARLRAIVQACFEDASG